MLVAVRLCIATAIATSFATPASALDLNSFRAIAFGQLNPHLSSQALGNW
jgi:hypothetical protein